MKKQEVKTEFKAMSLDEADSDYHDMTQRLALLHEKLGQLAAEKATLEAEIASAPQGGSYSANVAALLGEGDSTSSTVGKRARLRELAAEWRDIEQAVAIVERRRDDRISHASLAACNAARPEYAKRVAAFIDALRAAQATYNEVVDVHDALDREGVRFSYIQPVAIPFFNGESGAIARVIAEARDAGHVS